MAVHPTTHRFQSGDLTVLVGPSGCGKTTLLRMIAGLETPTSGMIHLNQQQIEKRPAWDRDIAMVFQNYALYPHMTVAQNIEFPLIAQKIPRPDRRKRTITIAQQLQIDHLLERKPRQLSGGQQQRVALGRALVREPQVFLMDEPLSNLDAALRTETRTEIKHLQHQLGITTIYVTHDQVEAMTLADSLVVMQDGKIQQVGTPETIYRHPANAFVAGFMGDPPMNILPYHKARTLMSMKGTLFEGYSDDELGYIGIRPESIQLSATMPIMLNGEIYTVETLGRETIVTLRVNQDTLIRAIIPADRSLEMLKRVPFGFTMDAIHLFDSHGQRIMR
ncbi:MAG: ABC transporter ATP-binding protein [Anaerolineae bacterium]